MVTDQQVRKLRKAMQEEETVWKAASKSGMDEKTARKYLRTGRLPSETKAERDWRTREDPFEEVWEEVRSKLEVNPGLEAKTLFDYLQRKEPGRFSDGQLRTLQRRVKSWRGVEGPAKEVFFAQQYRPGELCQSDFTHLSSLGVRIQGRPFPHLLYHFVLPYSDWETGTVCVSEAFESLSEGFQQAVWKLGGCPWAHRTDRMSTAVHREVRPEAFTDRYKALLKHYGMEGRYIQTAEPHENGDVEQRHHRFKKALDQSLMLRGSRDFGSRADYERFVEELFDQLNQGRQERLQEELKVVRRLPARRVESCRRIRVRVTSGSTIRVKNNGYSVHSRLIGEKVEARVYAERVEVWYAQRCVESLPRLRGEGKHRIDYRHIIDWLVRKPGAFENYRYRDELFPTSRFRVAYDLLKQEHSIARASREYLRILHEAAREEEAGVDAALGELIRQSKAVNLEAVRELMASGTSNEAWKRVEVDAVDLGSYDALLEKEEVMSC